MRNTAHAFVPLKEHVEFYDDIGFKFTSCSNIMIEYFAITNSR